MWLCQIASQGQEVLELVFMKEMYQRLTSMKSFKNEEQGTKNPFMLSYTMRSPGKTCDVKKC